MKAPPQFHSRILAPRWLPHRQARVGEGGEGAAQPSAAAAFSGAAAGCLLLPLAGGGGLGFALGAGLIASPSFCWCVAGKSNFLLPWAG